MPRHDASLQALLGALMTERGHPAAPGSSADGVGITSAAPVSRADWADGAVALHPPEGLRGALARQWLGAGRQWHAEIATANRLSLDLLRLGAAPSLLIEAQAMAADKVRHAQLAFTLASTFGGEPVGPGNLTMSWPAPSIDQMPFLARLLNEHCARATVEVAVLKARAEETTDEGLSAAFSDLVHDAVRHAAVGWRTLRWQLAQRASKADGDAVGAFLSALIDGATTSLVEARGDARHHPRWGLLDQEHQRGIALDAIKTAVVPCLHAALPSGDRVGDAVGTAAARRGGPVIEA